MTNTIPEILAIETGNLLEPLKSLTTADKVKAFLRDLGWEVTGSLGAVNPVPLVNAAEDLVTAITDMIAAEEEGDRIGALFVLLDRCATVITQLKTVADAAASAVPAIPDGDDVVRKAVDYLVAAYLEEYQPGVYGPLYLLGLVEETENGASTVRTVHWEKLGDLFSSPIGFLNTAFNWESNFDSAKFLLKFEEILGGFGIPGGIYKQTDTIMANLGRHSPDDQELRMPLFQAGVWGENWMEIDLNLSPIPAQGSDKAGFLLYPYFFGGASLDGDISEDWNVALTGSADMGSGLGLEIRPPARLSVKKDLFSTPQNSTNLNLELAFTRKTAEGPVIVIGTADASYLSYEDLGFLLFVRNADLGAEMQLGSLKLAIALGSDSDGLLSKIVPGGFETTFDLALGYSLANGFYFAGTGTLEIHFSTHIQLGPIEISGISLSLTPEAGGLLLGLGSTLKFQLGPFAGIVENMGLNAGLTFPGQGGKLGPVDYAVGFKPPTGIGLSLETDVVRGGGYLFFDPVKGEYGGALEICIVDKFSVTAIGLVSTIYNADGSKNYSLLLIVSVAFAPGIPLGMGFFLGGLGGLIGIHRTVNTDALREGVKNNAVDRILFPENVVENIQQIITDIREIFPPQQDQFMFGLMARITFGSPTILSADFGLIVEFDNPWRIVILGVVKAILPDPENAILELQINFAGILDFEAEYLSFDASIYNSRLLTITLEGDMAFRLFWGKEKAFLLSVGGFHPSFKPSNALKIGTMKRLTASLLSGNPSLALSAYFAITSNTVQFGAQIDFYYEKSGFKVVGYLGFDALFQFSPFWFTVGIKAGVSVKKGDKVLLSITLDLGLQGPTPWIAEGTAEFKVLGIKVSVNFTKQWGQTNQIDLPKVAVLPMLLEAFEQDSSWTSIIPADQFLMVSLRETELAEGEILLHSSGVFTVSEDIFPLGMILTRFGNDTPSDISKAWIDRLLLEGTEVNATDVFGSVAPAAFQEFKNAEKLSAPSYTEEKNGVQIQDADDLDLDYRINHTVEYEVRVSDFDNDSGEVYHLGRTLLKPGRYKDPDTELFTRLAGNAVAMNSVLSRSLRTGSFKLEGKAVDLSAEYFTIASTEDLSVYAGANLTGASKAEAESLLDQLLRNEPGLKGKVQVVSEYELE